MKELTKKVLESGLVDQKTVELMEKWGTLPEGSAELAKDPKLKDATKADLMKFAEEIGYEVEKRAKLHESMLDLDKIRWPATVTVLSLHGDRSDLSQATQVVGDVSCVIDRMGRYYFRYQDVSPGWFVPGYIIRRYNASQPEEILESDVIYIGEQPVCVQVTTRSITPVTK